LAGTVACMGEVRNSYSILVGNLRGKRPLGRPSRRWGHNIRMDIKEIVLEVVDWMHLVHHMD